MGGGGKRSNTKGTGPARRVSGKQHSAHALHMIYAQDTCVTHVSNKEHTKGMIWTSSGQLNTPFCTETKRGSIQTAEGWVKSLLHKPLSLHRTVTMHDLAPSPSPLLWMCLPPVDVRFIAYNTNPKKQTHTCTPQMLTRLYTGGSLYC